MNKAERLELYQTIYKWLQYSSLKDNEQRAIKALLGSLEQCEHDKSQYERHMLKFRSIIDKNEANKDDK